MLKIGYLGIVVRGGLSSIRSYNSSWAMTDLCPTKDSFKMIKCFFEKILKHFEVLMVPTSIYSSSMC